MELNTISTGFSVRASLILFFCFCLQGKVQGRGVQQEAGTSEAEKGGKTGGRSRKRQSAGSIERAGEMIHRCD